MALPAWETIERTARFLLEAEQCLNFEVGGLEQEEWQRLLIFEREARVNQGTSQNPNLVCICRQPYNKQKDLLFQCVQCGEWFHPRCMQTTRKKCQEERERGGWKCNGCKQSR